MQSTNPGSRRQQIILYYTLAVVLPGIILGYMAFRGIRNDQALSEKESSKRLEMNSHAFFAAIDSSLAKFMNEHTSDSLLLRSKKVDPFLLAFFVKDTINSKRLINHQLLYLPPEFLTGRSEQLSRPSNLKDGLRLEFIERRFSDALRFYQIKALKTTNSAEKIQTLVASARLYSKMNQPNMAKSLYDEIRKDHKKCLFNGQIPVGLIADLEILKINKILGEKDEIRNNSRQCLAMMGNGILAKSTHEHTIRFTSPLIITEPQIRKAIGLIQKTMTEFV